MQQPKLEAKQRLQVEITQDAFGRLTAMKETMGASSHAEVVRVALALMGKWLSHLEADGEVIFRDQDGKERIIEILF